MLVWCLVLISSPSHPLRCIDGVYLQVIMTMFLLLFSDIFVTLRYVVFTCRLIT